MILLHDISMLAARMLSYTPEYGVYNSAFMLSVDADFSNSVIFCSRILNYLILEVLL